jgi:hypothetical protein
MLVVSKRWKHRWRQYWRQHCRRRWPLRLHTTSPVLRDAACCRRRKRLPHLRALEHLAGEVRLWCRHARGTPL